MNPESNKKFVCLVIMDGWGLAAPSAGNAVSLANTVNFNRYWASFPHTQLQASGESVGLPRGEAGNTETGHLNLGAGKIVYQDLERINMTISDGTFFNNQVLIDAFEHAKKNNSNIHFMGLVGAGGVHSNLDHLFALISMAKKQDFNRVFLHLFTDGRDSPQTSSKTYINKIREVIKINANIGQIASIMGRYWAMDRDRRWDRTGKAYFALTKAQGHLVKTPEEAIDISYSQGKTDEFIEPSLITDTQGQPLALIKDNDSIIFYNFRIDRPRQLTAAFVVKDFQNNSLALDFDPYLDKYEKSYITTRLSGYQDVFERDNFLKNIYFATMTEYSKSLVAEGAKVIIPPEKIEMPLGRVISEANLRQLRMSESEKERFVTFYFNGQNEGTYPGEDRMIIPSPDVPTYDQRPEMSARQITEVLINSLKNNDYSFVLVNFANPDMVGHTGSIGPAVKACEVVDECVGKIANFVLAYGGTLLVTADHGNVEEMINSQTGQIDTEHNSSPVPFIAVSSGFLGNNLNLAPGILSDIAPTVLKLLGLQIPVSMTGRNLLEPLIK